MGKSFRKLLLQVGIGHNIRRMGAKMIAECDVIAKRNAVTWANVEVVSRLILRHRKRLSVFDSEIATMFISQSSQSHHHQGHFTSRRDHDVEVNDRLGSQAGDGGTSNMLKCNGNIAHERPDPISKATKLIGPFLIVVHHLNDAAGDWWVHRFIIAPENAEGASTPPPVEPLA